MADCLRLDNTRGWDHGKTCRRADRLRPGDPGMDGAVALPAEGRYRTARELTCNAGAFDTYVSHWKSRQSREGWKVYAQYDCDFADGQSKYGDCEQAASDYGDS